MYATESSVLTLSISIASSSRYNLIASISSFKGIYLSFELLRIIAIVLIIAHHLFVHVVRDQLLDSSMYGCGEMFNNFRFYIKLVLLEYGAAIGKIGVCLFILISGYFMCEKKEIDIELIHSEIYKPAKNATYTTEPYAIYKEENGLDFAITIEEAKQLLKEEKEEYIIPLKVLKPKITVSKLESAAFPNKLGSFTTYYSASDVNRNANIALAAKSITSVVLMPGEVFSYNNLIGECSTRTGYKESTIYLNGELAKGVGGGICQVSTTLYNAVLRANLEIVQRRNHSLSVTYVPLGHDAMVSIGSQDFQFKNNRDYPIRVVATTGPTSITCQIMGLAEEKEYDVKLYSRVISKTETKTKVETYKLLYLNGVEVSRTWLSTDTYKNH